MKRSKLVFAIILEIIAVGLIPYLVISLILLNFNIFNWSWIARAIYFISVYKLIQGVGSEISRLKSINIPGLKIITKNIKQLDNSITDLFERKLKSKI